MTDARPANTLYFDRAHIEEGIVSGADRPLVASPPDEWHTQATIASNPADPQSVVAAWCSHFDVTDAEGEKGPTTRVSVSYSTDGGVSWKASALPPFAVSAAADLGHPVLAFGPDEVAYLLAIEGNHAGTPHVFRSTDNGATWTAAKAPPERLSLPWLACDPARPGRLYVTTGFFRYLGEPSLQTAVVWRSDDSGETWSPRTVLRNEGGRPALAMAPHISVAADGTVHVVSVTLAMFADPAGHDIWHWRSIDAGSTFTAQRAVGPRPPVASSPVLSDEWVRVNGCAAAGRFVIAWADTREGVSRIYYRATDAGGRTWIGPDAGAPLLPGLPTAPGGHHLRPLLAATSQGVVGCAFYELAPSASVQRLAIMLAAAIRWEDGFGPPVAVSDAPWKPAREPASLLETDRSEPFVGDYFGLVADASSFLVLWPEAPAGRRPVRPPHSEDLWVHRTSEGWLVIRIRGGKVVGFVRFPEPAPEPGRVSDVARALRTLAALGTLDAGDAVHEPRAARALSHALRNLADRLDGAAPNEKRAPNEQRRR